MIVAAQVGNADQAKVRLVHGAKAEHVGQMGDALRHMGIGADVVFLQIMLNIQPVDHHLRREGLPAEEEREHRECGETVIVVRPHELRKVIRLFLMQQGGAGLMKAVHIHTNRFKGPGRRAIAAGKATEDVLMRIDEEVDIV